MLKRRLNKEMMSRMTSYDYRLQGEKILIRASVNTMKLIDKQSELKMEEELSDAFKLPVDVRLEQVLVASEKSLKQPQESKLPTGSSSTVPRVETTDEIKSKVEQLITNVQRDLTEALAPFSVSETQLTFASGMESLQVSTALKRDYPVEDDERLLLARLLERSLELPVVVTVKTIPLLPPLLFDAVGALTLASKASLELIKQLPGGSGAFRFVLDSPTRDGGKKSSVLKHYLTQELGVPDNSIIMRSTRRASESDGVRLYIVRRLNRSEEAQ